jgi:pimeloyl-ACP methyl ester carboxylesterase
MVEVERGMVLIPGGGLGPHQPLLNYSWLAGQARSAEALHIEWPADRPSSRNPADSASRVVDHVAKVTSTWSVQRPVLVGKSLGTYAAELAAERSLPAIWHTPLLSDQRCVAALRNAGAPCLLVGGTADPWWDGPLARTLSPHVVEVPGANHGVILPGAPLARSAAILGQIVTAVEAFLDDHVWPV